MESNPKCYQCIHRRNVPGDCHSECVSQKAHVVCDEHGWNQGWFLWPYNFDPIWMVSCTGFEPIETKKEEEK